MERDLFKLNLHCKHSFIMPAHFARIQLSVAYKILISCWVRLPWLPFSTRTPMTLCTASFEGTSCSRWSLFVPLLAPVHQNTLVVPKIGLEKRSGQRCSSSKLCQKVQLVFGSKCGCESSLPNNIQLVLTSTGRVNVSNVPTTATANILF